MLTVLLNYEPAVQYQYTLLRLNRALSLGVKQPGCEADHSPSPYTDLSQATHKQL
jgi:hypothetical protein